MILAPGSVKADNLVWDAQRLVPRINRRPAVLFGKLLAVRLVSDMRDKHGAGAGELRAYEHFSIANPLREGEPLIRIIRDRRGRD